ncbi:MAG: hypothetical protein DRQ49_09535 [Gammaproteobacteria bacterium]|nr:MAG: hypothetical protein DRQ49_09535 [Gammaproteobacteria bacterium]RKZ77052.1 MAG: hypothetical protein DRQ57_01605 [Gammaproteobacteria bacterium]
MTINPYQPPATESHEKVGTSAGGTLQDGIEGNYDFSITDVLKEAWQKTYGIKWTFFAIGIVFILIAVGISLIFTGLLQQLIFMIIMYPFLVGIMMIGVRRSVELPVSFSMAFGYFGYTIPIIIAAFLMSVLMIIGTLLLIIPGIYLSVAYLLTLPLIVEKNLGAWRAMEASRKAITHHWFKVFFTYFIMGIIYIISIIPLGIGLIWSIPMMVNVGGILYRIMFGVEEARGQ